MCCLAASWQRRFAATHDETTRRTAAALPQHSPPVRLLQSRVVHCVPTALHRHNIRCFVYASNAALCAVCMRAT
jgi:hypothetical protein